MSDWELQGHFSFRFPTKEAAARFAEKWGELGNPFAPELEAMLDESVTYTQTFEMFEVRHDEEEGE